MPPSSFAPLDFARSGRFFRDRAGWSVSSGSVGPQGRWRSRGSNGSPVVASVPATARDAPAEPPATASRDGSADSGVARSQRMAARVSSICAGHGASQLSRSRRSRRRSLMASQASGQFSFAVPAAAVNHHHRQRAFRVFRDKIEQHRTGGGLGSRDSARFTPPGGTVRTSPRGGCWSRWSGQRIAQIGAGGSPVPGGATIAGFCGGDVARFTPGRHVVERGADRPTR